jgi:protein SCO1/2
MRLLVLALLLTCIALGAEAALPRSVLDDVSVSLPPRAQMDLGLSAADAAGRPITLRSAFDGHPAFVTFADFTCTSLCGSDLRLLSNAIESAGLDPNAYRLLVIGIDPKDTGADAEKMAAGEIPPDIRASTVLLLPGQDAVDRLTRALGFRYAYDAELDQFAHPAAVYVVNAQGAVTGVMSPFALDPGTLSKALTAPAPQGSPTFGERIRILCYALGAATGLYTGQIIDTLKIAALLSLVLLAAGIAFAVRHRRVRR